MDETEKLRATKPNEVLDTPQSEGFALDFSADTTALEQRQRQSTTAFQFLAQFLYDVFEQRRVLLAVPFILCASIWVWFSQTREPSTQVWLFVWAALLVAMFFTRARLIVLIPTFAAFVFASGFALMNFHRDVHGTHMLGGVEYADVTATVDSILREDETAQRIIFRDLVLVEDARPRTIEALAGIKRVRIFSRSDVRVVPGQTVSFSARIYPVPGPVNVFGYDGHVQSFFDGIGAYGTLTGDRLDIISQPMPPSAFDLPKRWASLFGYFRGEIAVRISDVVSGEAAGILTAMMIGDQSGISDETRDVMSRSGVAHVLAISGLHLSLVAGGVFAVIRFMLAFNQSGTFGVGSKRIAAVFGLFTAIFYLGLSGASVSAIRATIMLTLVFLAIIFGRNALTLRNVAIAACFVLIVDPSAMLRPSFQLSFAAVAALVAVYEYFSNRRHSASAAPGTRLWTYVFGLFTTSLIAGLATAPFAAYHFQSVAPLGAFANIFVLPLIGFLVLPTAFLGLLAMPFGAEGLFFGVASLGIDWMLVIANFTASMGPSRIHPPQLTPTALFVFSAAIFVLVMLRSSWRFMGPIAALPIALIFGTLQAPQILVSQSTQAVALQTLEGYELVSGRTASFTTDVWQDALGKNIVQGPQQISCDDLGCVHAFPDTDIQVAIVKSPDAFAEDCVSNALIITRLYAPSWCAARVIDATSLNTFGVHEIFVSGNKLNIVAATPNILRDFRP